LKKIRLCRCIFIILIWFCCRYHVGSGVIKHFYVYKLLFILKNGWRVLGTTNKWASPTSMKWRVWCQINTEHRLPGQRSKRLATPSMVARHMCLGSTRRSSDQWVFPPSLLLKNHAAYHKKKKTRKSGYLFVKLDYVFILLIVMYLALNYLLNHYFFQFNPFTIDFYVWFGPCFFNCSASGLELFIKLFFFSKSSLYTWFLY
jgi:hypothetical protein